MDRTQKSESVSYLSQVFANNAVIVVAKNAGLTVAEMTALRVRMAKVGASTKVVKNRLAKLALRGTDAEQIAGLFAGPTLIAYSNDPVAAPKVAADFAKANDRFVLLGGALGKQSLDAEGVKALATLPSLDQLRAKLVGMIQTPATRIAAVVSAPGAQIARVLAAYAKKDEAA